MVAAYDYQKSIQNPKIRDCHSICTLSQWPLSFLIQTESLPLVMGVLTVVRLCLPVSFGSPQKKIVKLLGLKSRTMAAIVAASCLVRGS